MTYHGMDNCDDCGRPLEQRQWLVGLCRACEQAKKKPKGPVETVTPRRTLLGGSVSIRAPEVRRVPFFRYKPHVRK